MSSRSSSKKSVPDFSGKKLPASQSTAALADAPDYARIHRILKIISLIQGQKGWNAKTLSEECQVTQRTIYRDLDMLEGAGIPYFYDPSLKCYQIRRDFFMKPVELTLDESLAVIALGENIGGQGQIPFTRAANRAVAKIRSQLPESIRRELSGLDNNVAIQLPATGKAEDAADVYEKVRDAIIRRKALRCRYESLTSKNGDAEFLFEPYTLYFGQRAWYAVGLHTGRRGVRSLKLSRFVCIAATDRAYEIPKSFSLHKHLGNAWRMIRGDRKYDIELHFDAEFAETISDTHWHATQEIDWNDDGSIAFRCTVDGLDEIVWWVLSMGPHCKVNKPPELAKSVKELAARIVKLYPGD